MRNRFPHGQDGPAQVDLPAELDVTRLDRLQGARNEDRGVVDQDVEPAVGRDQVRHGGRNALGVTQVEQDRAGFAACGDDLGRDRVDGARQPWIGLDFGAGRHSYLRARLRQMAGDIGPDAAAGAGDERNLAGK